MDRYQSTPLIPDAALARAMRDALSYVASTGYVPWQTDEERTCTEQMQSRGFIEYESVVGFRLRHKGPKREPGRYYLTPSGRAVLQDLYADLQTARPN